MRSDHLAQRILSLVVPDERAAAIAGDLVEAASHRGGTWFWTSLARVVAALLFQDLLRAPLRFATFAVISWFAYMFVNLALMLLAVVANAMLWLVAFVFTNHTGVELLTDWFGVHLDWGPPPLPLAGVIELVIVAAAAPFLIGRIAAHWWPRRELAAALMMSVIWPVMAVLVPYVGYQAAATINVVPVIVICMCLGAFWARVRPPSQPSSPLPS